MGTIYQNREEYLTVRVTRNNCYFSHLHKEVELFYILDGSIEITVGEETSLLSKGMVSMAFPNVVHRTRTPEVSSAIMIIFPAEFVSDYSPELTAKLPQTPFLNSPSHPAELHRLMEGLLSCRQNSTDLRPAKGYLYLILSLLLPDIVLLPREAASFGICQEIAGYLDKHFTEPLSLDALAAALGYSKYHISHIFQENFGCSYTAYLNRLRAEHAMGLLTHSSMSATRACYASGFNSLRTFYRAFQEVYGITPGSLNR